MRFLTFAGWTLLAATVVQAEPIRMAPANPHYYFYRGKPVLLITSAEHYGAVINRDFNYATYLDALAAHGLNYTRFYPGAMFEPADLRRFMEGFDFVRMVPDKGFLVRGAAVPEFHRALSEPGQQYALYFHHSSPKVGGSYMVVPGNYCEEWVVRLAAGRYRLEWIDPETGSVMDRRELRHGGGGCRLQTPPYRIDLALKIKRR